jgi:hypothetical protein
VRSPPPRPLAAWSAAADLCCWCCGLVAGWLEWGREVTYALLKHDFDLELDIPIDQLCPPVPNRANYIYWLRDLLHRNSPQLCTGPDTRVRGLDMCASLLLPHHWLTVSSLPASVCCAPSPRLRLIGWWWWWVGTWGAGLPLEARGRRASTRFSGQRSMDGVSSPRTSTRRRFGMLATTSPSTGWTPPSSSANRALTTFFLVLTALRCYHHVAARRIRL